MGEIRFCCGGCGAKLQVGQEYVGRAVKCPKCGQSSTVTASLPDRPENDSLVLAEDITPGRPSEAFAVQLARAFIYPFKGNGVIVLAVATAIFVLLRLLAQIICAFVIIELLFLFYLCAYYVSVIASSAAGEDELPDWPDAADLWDGIIKPVFLMIANGVVSLIPLLVWMHFWGQWHFITDLATTLTVGLVLILWALLYIPMGLLAIALFNGVVALNPLVIVRAIAKIPLRYLLAWLIFFLVYFVNIFLSGRLAGNARRRYRAYGRYASEYDEILELCVFRRGGSRIR